MVQEERTIFLGQSEVKASLQAQWNEKQQRRVPAEIGHSRIQSRPLTANAARRNMIARRRWYFRGRVLKSLQPQ
jgi:hypothetical protein